MVGLIPLFAVEMLEPEMLEQAAGVPAAAGMVPRITVPTWRTWSRVGTSRAGRSSLAVAAARPPHEGAAPTRMLDETEFLSDYGVRALSKSSRATSRIVFDCRRQDARGRLRAGRVAIPDSSAATRTGAVRSGCRSTISSSSRCKSSTTITATTSRSNARHGSGQIRDARRGRRGIDPPTDAAVSARRRRPAAGVRRQRETAERSALPRLLLFHEYFHGDTGRGCGALHQTGWTGLVAKLLRPRRRERDNLPKP